MAYIPGDTIGFRILVTDESGALVDTDDLPTATLHHNLVDTAETVTITKKDTGIYDGQVTIPADWLGGDGWGILIRGEIDGIAVATGADGVLDAKRVGDLGDITAAEVRTEMDANSTKLANLDATVSSRAAAATLATLAAVFSGITSLANWLRAIARSDTADATAKAELNATGGTYNEAVNSLQAGLAPTAVTTVISNVDITPPADVELTTGYCLCLSTSGLPESGVTISAQMTEGPGTAGYALDRGTITMTSGEDGLAQHTGFVRGARYKFRRGTGSWTDSALAPDAASWELAEILGSP